MPSEKIVRVRLEQLCTNAARIQFGDCNNNFLTCYTNRSFSIDHCPFGEVLNKNKCQQPPRQCTDDTLLEINARTMAILNDVKFCSRGEGVYTFKESNYSRQAVVCHFISVDGTHCLLAAGNNVPSNVHYGNAIPFTTFLLQEFCARNSTKKYRLAPAVQMNAPCRSWYVDCQKSVQQIVNCERGALYDNTRQRCISDALSESTCSASTVQPSCNGRHWQTFSLERCSRRFFYCEGGIAREYVCAEGYKYYQGQCITETTVPECSSCVNAQPYRSFNVPCNEYLSCEDGHWQRRYCSENEVFSNAYHRCITGTSCEQAMECTLGTSYRISCSEYMQCQANGQFVHGTCPPLYAWDIDNARCVPDVNCVTYMGRECNDGAIIETNDCITFFYCSHRRWTSQSCATPTVDSRVISAACAQCTSQTISQAVPSYSRECIEGTSVLAQWSCTVYAKCVYGKWQWQQCEAPLKWSYRHNECSLESECTLPDYRPAKCIHNTRIAYFNLNACERYFECFDGSWRLFTCPSGEVFDMSTTRCVSFNGDCSQWLSGASVQPRHNSFNKLNWYPDAPNVNEKMSSGCVLGSTYRDDYDCSRYYACSSAGYLSYRCAHGTTFNAQKGICDGTNACDLSRCIDGSTRSLRKCGFYKICVQGMWIERVCDNGMQFINGQCQGYCSSSEYDGTYSYCNEGEAIADDRDCTLYLVCYKGYLEQRQCQYGTAFDPNVGYCRNGYSCPSGRSPNCYDSQKKAIDGETSKYLSCVEGTYYQRMCPAGQIFRSDINACDVGPVVDSTNHQSNIVNEACEESGGPLGYRADPSNCKKFYQCAQGRWVSKDCPPGLVWNSNAVVCDWPRNVPECNFM